MRVSEYSRQPGIRGNDRNTQFLTQLAAQRMAGRLACLDLAAGEFPIACPDFVGRTLGEEERAVGALQDGGGDFDQLGFFNRVVQ